ncbi:MAG: ABC transporter ATP-binding protein [Desulfobacteraceae bacterium]|nr:MAG: ABC transporter ATP-binding protein [Desulfobacteraceae bacterium]
MSNHLIEINELRTHFHVRDRIAKAVDNVSLTIEPGQTLGLVGESGCGKSVTAHSIMRLIPEPPGKIVGGQILFDDIDLVRASESKMRDIRGNRISMIFQEPMTSLNPVFTVGDQVAEVIQLHKRITKQELKDRVVEMFQLVGIPDPVTRLREYPHQMSGGMRQRVMIAMALACNPRLMIADEPTTALDVTIQAQILDLMNRLKSETGAAILFITHDLGVIAEMAQMVAVMYAGKIVEFADVHTLFAKPRHPYTIGLMESIPVLGKNMENERLQTIKGSVPSLFNLPRGCSFSNRCPDVFEDCKTIAPDIYNLGDNHLTRCLKYA